MTPDVCRHMFIRYKVRRNFIALRGDEILNKRECFIKRFFYNIFFYFGFQTIQKYISNHLRSIVLRFQLEQILAESALIVVKPTDAVSSLEINSLEATGGICFN